MKSETSLFTIFVVLLVTLFFVKVAVFSATSYDMQKRIDLCEIAPYVFSMDPPPWIRR